jgi:hypothetical protein
MVPGVDDPASDDPDDPDTGADASGLGRGWAPSEGTRAFALLFVGALLVAHPLVGGLPDAVGLTGNAEYAAMELTPDGGEIETEWVEPRDDLRSAAIHNHGGFTLLDCVSKIEGSRECALESGLTNRSLAVSRDPDTWNWYTYHDRAYERVETTRNGTTVLALRPVPAREALSESAVPFRDWSDTVRRAVEEGSVTVDPPLTLAGAVLERGGNFYAVFPTEFVDADESAGPLYTAAFTAVGVVLIGRSIRLGERT